jgi:hypothetical protein
MNGMMLVKIAIGLLISLQSLGGNSTPELRTQVYTFAQYALDQAAADMAT